VAFHQQGFRDPEWGKTLAENAHFFSPAILTEICLALTGLQPTEHISRRAIITIFNFCTFHNLQPCLIKFSTVQLLHTHQINTCKTSPFSICMQRFVFLCRHSCVYLCTVAASLKGTESKMKLWDILATCLSLLSLVSARPVFHNLHSSKRAIVHSEIPALDPVIDSQPESNSRKQASMEEQCKSACRPNQLSSSHMHICCSSDALQNVCELFSITYIVAC